MDKLEQLFAFVENGDNEEAKDLTNALLKEGCSPQKIIETMTDGMRKLGDLFEKKEVFLPELLVASDALMDVMEIVEPLLSSADQVKKKRVVIGTVEGDLHEIGKNLVGMVMKANGYEVIDLGGDVSIQKFIDTAEKEKADVIGMSSLMTTTMKEQQSLIEELKRLNIREKYKVMVGGAPISQKWADQIEADAYCVNAFETVRYLDSI